MLLSSNTFTKFEDTRTTFLSCIQFFLTPIPIAYSPNIHISIPNLDYFTQTTNSASIGIKFTAKGNPQNEPKKERKEKERGNKSDQSKRTAFGELVLQNGGIVEARVGKLA